MSECDRVNYNVPIRVLRGSTCFAVEVSRNIVHYSRLSFKDCNLISVLSEEQIPHHHCELVNPLLTLHCHVYHLHGMQNKYNYNYGLASE